MLPRLGNQAAAAASNAGVDLNLVAGPQPGITDGGEDGYCGPGATVTTDLDGQARPLSGTCDVGADESG
jgi:hypothetical protein